MGLAVARVDVIKNETDATIEIREEREGALPGYYGEIIELPPGEVKEIAATKFSNNITLSGRASFLKIFVNRKPTDASLSAPTLIHFSKIVFRRTPGSPQFTISGIRAKLTDIRRIRWFGWMGRDYEGRREETIAIGSFPG